MPDPELHTCRLRLTVRWRIVGHSEVIGPRNRCKGVQAHGWHRDRPARSFGGPLASPTPSPDLRRCRSRSTFRSWAWSARKPDNRLSATMAALPPDFLFRAVGWAM